MLAETKAHLSCLFVQESAMYSSFQCAYWHLFCTGTWCYIAEEAKLHPSPSSSSLALFQIDTPILCSPFSLQHLQAGGYSSVLPTHLSCKPLSSLEISSLDKSPALCCTLGHILVLVGMCVFQNCSALGQGAGPAGSGRSLLGAGQCLVELHVLGHTCPVENHHPFKPLGRDLLGPAHSNSSIFSSWKLHQHKSMLEAVELNVLRDLRVGKRVRREERHRAFALFKPPQ